MTLLRLTSPRLLALWPRFAAFGLAALLPSCLGDQFGGSESSGDGWCKELERHPISPSEMTPLGFRAKDILSFSTESYELPFGWSLPKEFSGLTLVPDEGDTTLHLSIDPDVTSLHYVVRTQDTGGRDIYVECPNYVEIETTLTFSTENGAFEETLPVTLRAQHALAATATIALEPGAMTGDFDLLEDGQFQMETRDERQPDRIDRVLTELDLQLFPGRATATMTSQYNLFYGAGDHAAVSGAEVTFGRSLGEGACYMEDFTQLLKDGEAVSRLSALLAETPRLAFDFKEGAEDTELHARLESSSFCLDAASARTLSFSVHAAITRAESDEPFATWPLSGVAVYSEEGALESLELSHHEYSPLPIDEAISTFGDFGVDFGDANQANFAISLTYLATGWAGELQVRGLNLLDPSTCDTTPKEGPNGSWSVDGCNPILSDEIVARASIEQVE